jgi:hypothetical protein
MEYKFQVLVVDDDLQIKHNFISYEKILMKKYNLMVEFTVINNEKEYMEGVPYDILMVDYNLKHGFFNSKKQLGNEFIEMFRKKNKVSKVIFYSSEFEYSIDTKKFNFPLADKEIFELINKLQIDKVAAKSNFDMMIQVIKECCEELDIITLLLSRTLKNYETNDISVNYTNIEGKDIEISSLLTDVLNDNAEGKEFKKRVIDTVLSMLFKYKY